MRGRLIDFEPLFLLISHDEVTKSFAPEEERVDVGNGKVVDTVRKCAAAISSAVVDPARPARREGRSRPM